MSDGLHFPVESSVFFSAALCGLDSVCQNVLPDDVFKIRHFELISDLCFVIFVLGRSVDCTVYSSSDT